MRGDSWRILAWTKNGKRVAVESKRSEGRNAKLGRKFNLDRHKDPHALLDLTLTEHAVFDELVIGDWFHLEQLDSGQWWICVGGWGNEESVDINVDVGPDGKARSITVEHNK